MFKTQIMGILNLTPDSFYDSNQDLHTPINTFKNKLKSLKKADIIDIGCESTRPGSKPISSSEELLRLSILDKLNIQNKLLSIDSYKPEIIEFCLKRGFSIINDISGGGINFDNISIAKKYSCKIILMHMQGVPKTMQNKPVYSNIVDDLNEYFSLRLEFCKSIGLPINDVMIDPGIGFGKTIKNNDDILLNLQEFKHFKCKIVVGISRKSFLRVSNDIPSDRLPQTIGVNAIAAYKGADILRVHDVDETFKMLNIINRLKAYG